MYGLSGEYILSAELSVGFIESIPFALNSDCQIMGCTSPNADNYNPSASIDDGTCIYTNTLPPNDNVLLLSNWNNDLPQNGFGGSYNEVYGFWFGDKEYGIIGSTMGTHIIDVTIPEEPIEVAFIPGEAQGSSVTHRDFHTINNYLYTVCDQGASTLQIIDLSNLPYSVDLVYNSSEFFQRAHNIFIDEENYKLYTCSTEGLTFSGTCVFDITNPESPQYLYTIPINSHDIYVESNIAYINGSGGVWVYDCSSEPQLLGSLTDYPFQGGNHSGWKLNDVYIFADENFGYDLKVCDVSNINEIEVVSTFNSNVSNSSIPHNLIIKDNYVFLSYYHDGLQIFDVSDPAEPKKVGFYDTYLQENGTFYAGAWGVYPLLPSGNILISDISSGLFVLEFSPDIISICEGESLYLEGGDQFNDGVYVDVFVEDGVDNIVVTELTVLPNYNEYDCWGECFNDVDLDDICDEFEIDGCSEDETACNYNIDGTEPCVFSEDLFAVEYLDCYGNCLNDMDGDMVCDEEDNCIEVSNPNQEDINMDGVGDDCDGIGLYEPELTKGLIKVTDLLGRDINKETKGVMLIYWYKNGEVYKKNIY